MVHTRCRGKASSLLHCKDAVLLNLMEHLKRKKSNGWLCWNVEIHYSLAKGEGSYKCFRCISGLKAKTFSTKSGKMFPPHHLYKLTQSKYSVNENNAITITILPLKKRCGAKLTFWPSVRLQLVLKYSKYRQTSGANHALAGLIVWHEEEFLW